MQRFERYADAQGWKKKSWGVNLSALLQGKGVSTYNRLSPIDANNYDILKPELLKAYHLTEDGFREKLRSAKPEQNESAQQFLARISDYLDRWIDLSESPRDFVGIVDLLLREQFINSCSKDMAIFIKERHPKDVKDMAIMASQYIDARGGWGLVSKSKTSNHKGQIGTKYTPSHTVNTSKESVENKPVRKCFLCAQPGHIAMHCRNRSKILKAAGLEVNDEMEQGKHKPKGAAKKKGLCKG